MLTLEKSDSRNIIVAELWAASKGEVVRLKLPLFFGK
jgi:hypothetical protein